MRLWIARLLLIALLPWHGLASAAGAAIGGDTAREAIAHWAEEAHHHHDAVHALDATHADGSLESLLHLLHANAHCNVPAVLPAPPACPAVAAVAVAPEGAVPAGHPRPFLEGPRRPPRALR